MSTDALEISPNPAALITSQTAEFLSEQSTSNETFRLSPNENLQHLIAIISTSGTIASIGLAFNEQQNPAIVATGLATGLLSVLLNAHLITRNN